MTAVDPEGRIRHPLDVFHSTFNPDGTNVAAGMVPSADGSGQVEYLDSSTFGSAITIKDEGSSLTTAATSIDFVGAGVTASGTTAAKTVTISGAPTGAAGGDLSGTYPNPSVVDDSHNHTASTISGVIETGDAAGGDLSGTYPNPSVVDDSHNHTSATLPATAGTGELVIASVHSSPLIFDDIVQNSDGDDLVYASA